MKNKHHLLIVTITAATIMSVIPSYLVIPVSNSVRPSLLIKLPWKKPQKGDYVTFELQNEKLHGGHAFLTKRIGCMPGEHLENRSGAFFCNNNFMVIALDKDGYGHALSQFQFDGIIPTKQAFMVGDNPNSYDSRYWGLTSIDNAVYSYPIF